MNMIQQNDVDIALKGLLNEAAPTAHPVADKVIRSLWDEVEYYRDHLRGGVVTGSTASDLVNEGLDYFYKSGDEGDKEYVRAIRAHIAALTAAQPARGVGAAFEQECSDVDQILRKLGLKPESVRTQGGYLMVPRILNHIQETLDALAQATQFGQDMAAKYGDLALASAAPAGFVVVPVEPTKAMVSSYVSAVNEHLGAMTEKDWEIERFDPNASIHRVARIGITAMLAASQAHASHGERE